MGVTDGTIGGLTKILDNGPNASRHNIVLVAEGFSSSEQSDFNDLCDEFITTIEAESWFSELGKAINIFRLNVNSDESGTDLPATCPDGETGPGSAVDTYFDASFCNSGIWRCLSGDEIIVRNTLDTELPEWHTAAVLVNSTERGGCASGNVFWTAISSDWKEVVIHELGHASFNLADEYHYWAGCGTDTDRDYAPAGEPSEVNVTSQVLEENLKWKYFIEDTTPVPTMQNPDCSQCDNRANVLASDDIIGLYEGAKYYHCGRFRPAYVCKMRNSSKAFCRVCVDGIAETLAEFIDDEPTIEIIPNFIDFGEVAFGLTIHRYFEIRNVKSGCPKSIEIDLGAISGDPAFTYSDGTPLSFRLPAPVFEPYTSQRIYVAFTAVDDGMPLANGNLEITTSDVTSDLPEMVNLSGTAIPPPPVDSVLVLDRSDSMDGDSGVPGQSKMDIAIEAANLYVSLLKPNDKIGIVRYNHEARNPQDILLNMRPADPAGKSAASSALSLSNLNPDGFTSIGGGIILGSEVLDNGSAENRALVVLTDGIQNRNPDIPDATAVVQTKSPRQRVFAVGLGLNQLEDKLAQIATLTNGVAQITGDFLDEREFLLKKLYVQILSDVSDEAFVKDPPKLLLPGQKQATNIFLTELEVAADFILVFRRTSVFPKYLRVWLEAPDGTILNASDISSMSNGDAVFHNTHLYYRLQFPVKPNLPEMHIGKWKMWVENFSGRQVDIVRSNAAYYYGGNPLYYSVMCKARSNFRLEGRIEQNEYTPGSAMKIILCPSQYGLPVQLNEPVRVDLFKPNGQKTSLTLSRDEQCYSTHFTDTSQLGHYRVVAEVSAKSPSGNLITRYREMTAIIFRPGQTGTDPDANGKDEDNQLKECCKMIYGKLDEIQKTLREKCE